MENNKRKTILERERIREKLGSKNERKKEKRIPMEGEKALL